jgi:hypothetical protein
MIASPTDMFWRRVDRSDMSRVRTCYRPGEHSYPSSA